MLSVHIPSSFFCGKADFGYENTKNSGFRNAKLFSIIRAY